MCKYWNLVNVTLSGNILGNYKGIYKLRKCSITIPFFLKKNVAVKKSFHKCSASVKKSNKIEHFFRLFI